MVLGRVACSSPYALPMREKSSARFSTRFSSSLYELLFTPVGSGMRPKFTFVLSPRAYKRMKENVRWAATQLSCSAAMPLAISCPYPHPAPRTHRQTQVLSSGYQLLSPHPRYGNPGPVEANPRMHSPAKKERRRDTVTCCRCITLS